MKLISNITLAVPINPLLNIHLGPMSHVYPSSTQQVLRIPDDHPYSMEPTRRWLSLRMATVWSEMMSWTVRRLADWLFIQRCHLPLALLTFHFCALFLYLFLPLSSTPQTPHKQHT